MSRPSAESLRLARDAATLERARAIIPSTDAAISSLDSQLPREVESNNTAATATALPMSNDQARIQGTIGAVGDTDYFSFTAQAGDRLFAATTTASSATSGDTFIEVLAADGSTVIESDNDNGSQGEQASAVAGVPLPTAGTYYVRVTELGNDARVLPYRLYAQLQRGAPLAEVEPNNDTTQAQSLDAAHWAAGNLSAADPRDFYKITLAAGDTILVTVDQDPERDGIDTPVRLNFGSPSVNFEVATADVGGVGPDAQVLVYTVRQGGIAYYIYPDVNGGAGGSYRLSVSVFQQPVSPPERRCYTVNNPGGATAPQGGEASLPLAVNVANPGLIDDVNIEFNGRAGSESDISLRSPGGTEIALFQNVANPSNGTVQMTFDDEAATPLNTPALNLNTLLRAHFQPQGTARLAWLDGTRPNGTWQLIARDEVSDSNTTGVGNAILTICERPAPPACPAGTTPYTAYSADFETSSGGMSHSGTQDQWALGLPSGSAIADCASGGNCWKTHLTGAYAANSNQNLVSSPINLGVLQAPLIATWSQKYQLESAAGDNFTVDAEQLNGTASSRLFEHIDGTMQASLGAGPTMVDAAAGWATQSARIDEFAGQTMRLRFHLDSNGFTELAGAAIDDVSVTGCRSTTQADASVVISDGTSTVSVPSGQVTYNIVASNTGPADIQANFATSFGVGAVCTWTATYSNGATGATSGSGNIAQSLAMPLDSQAFFVAVCQFPALMSGTTTTTASIAITGAVSDANPGNNTTSDVNTFVPANDTMFSDGFE